jgi:hypothetical protein
MLEEKWDERKRELEEIGMFDDVVYLIRECYLYIMDIKFVGDKVHFELMYSYILKNHYWLKEGIGEEVVEEMLWNLEIPPYDKWSYERKKNKMVEIGESLKMMKEYWMKKKDDTIYN